jgi:hypothetical protein
MFIAAINIHRSDAAIRVRLMGKLKEKTGVLTVFFISAHTSQPFTCPGTAGHAEHPGSKPMRIVWKLDHPTPPGLMKQANKAIRG